MLLLHSSPAADAPRGAWAYTGLLLLQVFATLFTLTKNRSAGSLRWTALVVVVTFLQVGCLPATRRTLVSVTLASHTAAPYADLPRDLQQHKRLEHRQGAVVRLLLYIMSCLTSALRHCCTWKQPTKQPISKSSWPHSVPDGHECPSDYCRAFKAIYWLLYRTVVFRQVGIVMVVPAPCTWLPAAPTCISACLSCTRTPFNGPDSCHATQ